MGLAFVGGFASGMSKSIEKSRDRKLEQDALVDQQNRQNAAIKAKQVQTGIDISNKNTELNMKIDEEIMKIKSGDSELTPSERVARVNQLNKQKVENMKRSMQHATDSGIENPNTVVSGTVGDVNQTDMVIGTDGKEYLIDQHLAYQIQQDPNLELRGADVYSRVMEKNSKGNMIPSKDSLGKDMWELEGTTLAPFGSEYATEKTTGKRTGTSTGLANNMSESERSYYKSQGIDPDTVSVSVLDDMRKSRSKDNIKHSRSEKEAQHGADFIDNRLDKNAKNRITYGTEVTGNDIRDAKRAQGSEKMDAAMKKELAGKLGIYKDGAEIIKYISDNNVDFDLSETAKNEISKIAGESFEWGDILNIFSKDSKELKPEERVIKDKANSEMIKRITADTKLQNLVANYVKIISGAAVTDQERQNFYKIITAGQYADETALLTAMTSFVDSIGDNYKNTYDALKYDVPANYVTSVKAWNDADKSSAIGKYRQKNIDKINKPNKKVVRTGKTKDGRKVTLYDDGSKVYE